MANTGRPNSGGSQFFINVTDNSYLDWFNLVLHQASVLVRSQKDMILYCDVQVPTVRDNPVEPIQVTSIEVVGISLENT